MKSNFVLTVTFFYKMYEMCNNYKPLSELNGNGIEHNLFYFIFQIFYVNG